MNKTQLSLWIGCLVLLLATSVFAATISQPAGTGSITYGFNQIILGCDNSVAQSFIQNLYLDSDDCILPGDNSARIKLIRTGSTNQILLVGDSVGLEAAIEALRMPNYYSSLADSEVIVVRNISSGMITATSVASGFGTATVPSLTSLGNGNYQYSVELNAGWNFVSFPIVLSNDEPTAVFSAIRSKMFRIFSYDPIASGIKWIKWNPEIGAPSEITNILPQTGYILYMNQSATLTAQGRLGIGSPEVPPSLAISSGWNLITIHGLRSRAASSALNSIAGKYDSVWTIVNNQMAMLDLNTNPLLQPGQTYWVHMTNSGELVP